MKKILMGILDWIVLLGTVASIVILLKEDNLFTSWKTPVFLNLYALLIMLYVQFFREDKEKRFQSISDYASFLKWINVIAFTSHLTIGIYGKYNYTIPIVPALRHLDLPVALQISAIYLIIILITTILSRKNNVLKK